MKNYYLCICLIFLFGCGANSFMGTSFAQNRRKNIVISDELAATAEVLKVKMDTKKPIKDWGIKFGDYNVLIIELGDLTESESWNFLGTKLERETKDEISFILTNKTSDSARVEAMTDILIKESRSLEIFRNFHWGYDALSKQSHFLSSLITTNYNKNEIWLLSIKKTYGSSVDYKNEAFLSNGERTITIFPVSSNTNGTDRRMYPALGYEFFENDQSLCAVQYHSGGALGYFKKTVWIKSDLAPGLKLILSAAMTSLMLLKTPD